MTTILSAYIFSVWHSSAPLVKLFCFVLAHRAILSVKLSYSLTRLAKPSHDGQKNYSSALSFSFLQWYFFLISFHGISSRRTRPQAWQRTGHGHASHGSVSRPATPNDGTLSRPRVLDGGHSSPRCCIPCVPTATYGRRVTEAASPGVCVQVATSPDGHCRTSAAMAAARPCGDSCSPDGARGPAVEFARVGKSGNPYAMGS